ncbi:DUF2244 domain-containing protein [Pseudoxanthomonas gei]|uniref:DUF2244 domain-containing protein n=1 Tax=Pseudoxanthomonas gei TaxID=1383030 RepID=A0ABX0ADL3_9GAMM|nr:DUF2244 domain-containing protein [Pseudoxanthomonas gei]NDK38973.1 DUF2244 domain-containing protein [Pseudoxanthomonas gei]
MIEVVPSFPIGHGARLRLRPPRAMTAAQFRALFAVLAGSMWLVAVAGWLGGNVFAPAFALLHSAIVAAALRWLWRSGERNECINIDPQMVEVSRTSENGVLAQSVFRAHPCWVRLRIEEDGERISLASSGRQVQVGNFLGPAERRELARQLQDLLAAAGRYR